MPQLHIACYQFNKVLSLRLERISKHFIHTRVDPTDYLSSWYVWLLVAAFFFFFFLVCGAIHRLLIYLFSSFFLLPPSFFLLPPPSSDTWDTFLGHRYLSLFTAIPNISGSILSEIFHYYLDIGYTALISISLGMLALNEVCVC